MTGGTGAVKNILYSDEFGLDLPKEVQIRRILRVIEKELTPRQKETLEAHYFEELSASQIARRQGIHRSTALRTLRRAEDRIRRHLKY